MLPNGRAFSITDGKPPPHIIDGTPRDSNGIPYGFLFRFLEVHSFVAFRSQGLRQLAAVHSSSGRQHRCAVEWRSLSLSLREENWGPVDVNAVHSRVVGEKRERRGCFGRVQEKGEKRGVARCLLLLFCLDAF